MGLTGGFGTGKSTVADFFREFGAQVIDADRLAHRALRKDSPVFPRLRACFKEAVCPSTGGLRRKVIAAIIFGDPKRRKEAEALIHPYVGRQMREIAAASRKSVVVLEVPLLFEAGMDRLCDRTVVVEATDGERTQRLLRRGFSRQEIKARQAAQMPLREKIRRADAVIHNSGQRNETKRQARLLWEKFCAGVKRS